MPDERAKMLRGEMYQPLDPVLSEMRRRARLLCQSLNVTRDDQAEERGKLLAALIPDAGPGLWLEPPFYTDYGCHITLGEKVFFNFNCVVLDVCPVTIGSRTMFGPGVQILTPLHPMDAKKRAGGLEYGAPISIGEDVWVGGGAIICPGVTVGSRTVIGAGSVVTRSIPDDVFAAGNPCRVIRTLGPGSA